ncbi:MAG: hypothetical protein LBG14_07435, partial [Treponema sp.]|nr:hypothetical protein [Treponema sp.]
MPEWTCTDDDFGAYLVTNANDSGPGSLRQALEDLHTLTGLRSAIQILLPPESAIALESALPQITRSAIIEGNGVTLTRAASWTDSSDTSQLLFINSSDAAVTIRRLHFKDGLATSYGGAVRIIGGSLTLESCIFSGNRTTSGDGGAVHSRAALNGGNTLIIRGCTFYGNTAGYGGGAVCFNNNNGTLDAVFSLRGNLFYGNSGPIYPVALCYNLSTTAASYNVTDTEFGKGSTQCGWNQGFGDVYATTPFVSGKTFRVLSGSSAAGRFPAAPYSGSPAVDFYGQPINAKGSAGAVQAVTPSGRSYLDLSVNNSLAGNVSINPAPDEDGLIPNGSVTLEADTSGDSNAFLYWLRDGVQTATNPYTLDMNGHARIQAVFSRAVTVNNFTTDSATAPGTLRHALTNAQDMDVIRFSGVTPGITEIALESALPQISKSMTIEGNGVTLTRAASWTDSSDYSQLLIINSIDAAVRIRGMHFKNGLAETYGGAINNRGALTLESCIFSGNRTAGRGGAIYSTNTLTIRGCTFFGNSATGFGAGFGGVLVFTTQGKTLTLTGNLFYGNTASKEDLHPVVARYNDTGNVAASYNVTDVDFGTDGKKCGWIKGTGDIYITALPLSPKTFKVFNGNAAAGNLPGILPAGYPLVDFYGQPINGGGASGAVQTVTVHGSGYSYLDLSVNNSLAGYASINPAPDEDGLFPNGHVTLEASTSGDSYAFIYWLREGVQTTTNPYTLDLKSHTRIQAVFSRAVTVDKFTDGAGSAATPGTLRYALANARDMDVIRFSGVTPGVTEVALKSHLPSIDKSIVIEGEGITLTKDFPYDSSGKG